MTARIFQRLSLIVLCAGMATACVTPPNTVRTDGSTLTTDGGSFSLRTPEGWVRLTRPAQYLRDTVIMTRDGFPLHMAVVARYPHEQAFTALKKSSSPNMLPSELAELYLADMMAGGDYDNVKLLESRLAKFGGGHTGFLLHLQLRDNQGLRRDNLVYGVAVDSGYYLLEYVAPTLHYFPRDKETFVDMVKSFNILGTRRVQK